MLEATHRAQRSFEVDSTAGLEKALASGSGSRQALVIGALINSRQYAGQV